MVVEKVVKGIWRVIDMTIDEAIAKYKEITNTDANCPAHCNISCDKCVQESKQLAEWLELLKWYEQGMEDIPSESGVLPKDVYHAGYNKAIDDFAEKLNAKCDGMIKDKWNSNVAPISWAEAYADFKDDIDEIAEQLKAGGENDNLRR